MSYLYQPIAFLLIMMVGYGLKQKGVFCLADAQVLLKIIMNLTLPMAVLHAFPTFSKDASLLWVVFLGFVCALVPLILLYFTTRKKSQSQRAFYMINVAGYNIGCFSLPIISAFFGVHGAMIACMFDIGNAVMMTGGSYAFTSTLLHCSAKKEHVTDILKKFVSSIPFDMYMLMLILSLMHVQIPDFILQISAPFANANAFLAMLMLGILFQVNTSKQCLVDSSKLLLYRFLFALLFACLMYYCLPFDWEVKRILIIVVFAPISTLGPPYTMKCKGDVEQASFANSLSIVLALFVMSTLSFLFMQ